MFYALLGLFAAVIVALDQLSKYLTVANIPLYTDIPVINGLFHLTYAQNTGAAFSALEGQQWLFALMFVALTLALAYQIWKKTYPLKPFEWWCIAAIYGGGVGNMIDRLRLGYVIDMIEVEFIRFPVFNVADSFITCGVILLLVHLVFFNKEFWKDEKK